MGFKIVYGNIIDLQADAIVNPTDRHYSGGGGVDYLIHQTVGPELRAATDVLSQLHLGEARATAAFNLKARYIIHTSAPRWRGEDPLALSLLSSCYRNSISTARLLGCRSICFPLIGSKGKRIPKEIALSSAIDAIHECLAEKDDIDVTLVIYSEREEDSYRKLLEAVQSFLDENYIPPEEPFSAICHEAPRRLRKPRQSVYACNDLGMVSDNVPGLKQYKVASPIDEDAEFERLILRLIEKPTIKNLEGLELDEDFSTTLALHIHNSGLKQSEIYDQLDMSKTGFWKILKGKTNPSRLTVFALAIALKLNLEQTKDLLMKAGYAINRSSVQDMVLAGLIASGNYDRYKIDGLLYDLDLLPLPGAIND